MIYSGLLLLGAFHRSHPVQLVLTPVALLLLPRPLVSSVRSLLHRLLNLVPHPALFDVEQLVEVDREVERGDEEFGESGEEVERNFARGGGEGRSGCFDVDVYLVCRGDGLGGGNEMTSEDRREGEGEKRSAESRLGLRTCNQTTTRTHQDEARSDED